MDMLRGIGIFICFVVIIEGLYFAARRIRNREKKAVRKRLKNLQVEGEEEGRDILRKKLFGNIPLFSTIPWFNRLLLKFRWTEKAHGLLTQASIERPLGFFILISLLLAAGGFVFTFQFKSNLLGSVLVGLFLGVIPYFYIRSKRARRMKRFQEQFPEALELIARALKAGHAFTGGLKLVSDEMKEPIGTEFGMALEEINFGVGIPEALKNLSGRVYCPDLKFFVISVTIQRETGGNLAEILEKIAYLIRERFKLHGKIRVLAAQGKLSALILALLPFFIAAGLMAVNRKYMMTLATDPVGKNLVVFALIAMFFGILIMRRMIAIKV